MAKAKRAGGRASRVAQRTAPVAAVNPCPPGQIGGQYQPLTAPDMQRIIDTAFDILADIGMGEVPQRLLDIALAKGGALNDLGRLTFSRAMMEDMALMFEWFDRVGYTADISGLAQEFPEVEWSSFEDWAKSVDWQVLAA